MTVDERISRYLAAVPACVALEGGDTRLYQTACALVHGFCLSEEEALRHLRIYNKGCRPPWPDSRMVYKVSQAIAATNHKKPFGYLRNTPPPEEKSVKSGGVTEIVHFAADLSIFKRPTQTIPNKKQDSAMAGHGKISLLACAGTDLHTTRGSEKLPWPAMADWPDNLCKEAANLFGATGFSLHRYPHYAASGSFAGRQTWKDGQWVTDEPDEPEIAGEPLSDLEWLANLGREIADQGWLGQPQSAAMLAHLAAFADDVEIPGAEGETDVTLACKAVVAVLRRVFDGNGDIELGGGYTLKRLPPSRQPAKARIPAWLWEHQDRRIIFNHPAPPEPVTFQSWPKRTSKQAKVKKPRKKKRGSQGRMSAEDREAEKAEFNARWRECLDRISDEIDAQFRQIVREKAGKEEASKKGQRTFNQKVTTGRLARSFGRRFAGFVPFGPLCSFGARNPVGLRRLSGRLSEFFWPRRPVRTRPVAQLFQNLPNLRIDQKLGGVPVGVGKAELAGDYCR
jgi:hypothetical protein